MRNSGRVFFIEICENTENVLKLVELDNHLHVWITDRKKLLQYLIMHAPFRVNSDLKCKTCSFIFFNLRCLCIITCFNSS